MQNFNLAALTLSKGALAGSLGSQIQTVASHCLGQEDVLNVLQEAGSLLEALDQGVNALELVEAMKDASKAVKSASNVIRRAKKALRKVRKAKIRKGRKAHNASKKKARRQARVPVGVVRKKTGRVFKLFVPRVRVGMDVAFSHVGPGTRYGWKDTREAHFFSWGDRHGYVDFKEGERGMVTQSARRLGARPCKGHPDLDGRCIGMWRISHSTVVAENAVMVMGADHCSYCAASINTVAETKARKVLDRKLRERAMNWLIRRGLTTEAEDFAESIYRGHWARAPKVNPCYREIVEKDLNFVPDAKKMPPWVMDGTYPGLEDWARGVYLLPKEWHAGSANPVSHKEYREIRKRETDGAVLLPNSPKLGGILQFFGVSKEHLNEFGARGSKKVCKKAFFSNHIKPLLNIGRWGRGYYTSCQDPASELNLWHKVYAHVEDPFVSVVWIGTQTTMEQRALVRFMVDEEGKEVIGLDRWYGDLTGRAAVVDWLHDLWQRPVYHLLEDSEGSSEEVWLEYPAPVKFSSETLSYSDGHHWSAALYGRGYIYRGYGKLLK